jgi:hypothetical protein
MSHWTRVNSRQRSCSFLCGSAAAVLGWLKQATGQGTAAGFAAVRVHSAAVESEDVGLFLVSPAGLQICKGPGMNASAFALVSRPL